MEGREAATKYLTYVGDKETPKEINNLKKLNRVFMLLDREMRMSFGLH